MNKEWQQLTREEKREHRVNKWISPSDIEFKSPEAEKNYRDRANRISFSGKAVAVPWAMS